MAQRKLLLADDSITIQKVINLTFADEGIEVTAVGNGLTAIERLREVAPDLVLADVHMPGLTGYEVCERIRQTPGYENIPVMLLVGSFEPFDEAEARRVGADDFLTKPFQSIKQLVSKVHSLLESAAQNSAPAQSAPETQSAFTSAAAANQDTAFDFFDEKKPNENVSPVSESNFNFRDVVFDDEMIQTTPANPDFVDTFEDLNLSELSAPSEKGENEWRVVELQDNNQFDKFSHPQHDSPIVELDLNDAISDAGEDRETNVADDGFDLQIAQKTSAPSEAMSVETPAPEIEIPPGDFQMSAEETPTQPLMAADDKADGEIVPEIDLTDLPEREKSASPFADLFDDEDLLGIEDEIRAEISEQNASSTQPENQTETIEAITPEIVAPEQENKSQEIATVNQSSEMEKPGAYANLNFPPEVIDAIAARVVERLSDKVIEKIAWEIVPDRFDLIVRKTIQNKDRER